MICKSLAWICIIQKTLLLAQLKIPIDISIKHSFDLTLSYSDIYGFSPSYSMDEHRYLNRKSE